MNLTHQRIENISGIDLCLQEDIVAILHWHIARLVVSQSESRDSDSDYSLVGNLGDLLHISGETVQV